MKSFMKLFMQFNNWIIENMNKFYLWFMIAMITISGISFYQVNHPINLITYIFIILFLMYTEWKIIFR